MKFIVTASAFERDSGDFVGGPRVEKIDTETNELFKNAKTVLDIKTAYESFWNDLNPHSEEVVFVSQVKSVQ